MSNSWQSTLRRTRSNSEPRSISACPRGHSTLDKSNKNTLLHSPSRPEEEQPQRTVENENAHRRQENEEERQRHTVDQTADDEISLLRQFLNDERQRADELQAKLDDVSTKVEKFISLIGTHMIYLLTPYVTSIVFLII